MKTVTITSTIKKYPKRHPYEEMKRKVLGAKYELSLVFIGSKRASSLNKAYRKKSYSPNVLSFPLTETSGEIFICPDTANKEAHKFDLSPNGYIAYLFIHGLVHLKGHDHGDTMDKLERKYLKAFNIK
jgi:probable rRNA maturation factor